MTETADRKLSVDACHSHYGHRKQLQHTILTNRQHKAIAQKVQQGVPSSRILSDIRNDVGNTLTKMHLVEKQDISNIARSFSLEIAHRHPNDQDSVASWIRECEEQPYNPVLFYKLQGEAAKGFEVEDFMIVLQTELQQQLFVQFAPDGICLDTTLGTNMYDFLLTTIMVVDEFGEGQPVGWCLSNHESFPFLRCFFQKIMGNAGRVTPKWLMSDLAPQFYDAFSEVNNCTPKHLFCSWHVDKAWKEEIRKKISCVQLQAEVYKMLRVVLEQTDICSFHDYLDALMERLRSVDGTRDFAEYFERFWVQHKESWGYCYRVGEGINTNMFVEAFHRVLKYNYLQGKYNRRVDACLSKLEQVNNDKVFQRLIKLTKGKSTFKASIIRKRHLGSLQLRDSDVTADPESANCWLVKSEHGNNIYKVTWRQEGCNEVPCQLKCTDCGSCCHSHQCSCLDFLMNAITCKHIHLVQRLLITSGQKKPCEEQPTADIDYKEEAIERTFSLVTTGAAKNVSDLRDKIINSLTELISDVGETSQVDEEALKFLSTQVSSAKNTFDALRKKKLEELKSTVRIAPNTNVKRQHRFFSTKSKRKAVRTRIAKPSLREKEDILKSFGERKPG